MRNLKCAVLIQIISLVFIHLKSQPGQKLHHVINPLGPVHMKASCLGIGISRKDKVVPLSREKVKTKLSQGTEITLSSM